MAFLKKGTPTSLNIVSNTCQRCKKNKVSVKIDGELLCQECLEKMEKTNEF